MSYSVTERGSKKLICMTTSVEEALIAEAMGKQVNAHGYDSILELVAAKVEQDPDRNQVPAKEERYVRFTSKAGNNLMCEVVRLFCPDEDGYPVFAELINLQRTDGSFIARTSQCKVVDLSKMTPELANALLQGETYEENGGGNTPKLKHGLRK